MPQTKDHTAHVVAEWARVRPDLDASPMALIGRLHRLANHLTADLAIVYREYGLSEGEFDLLATLRRGNDVGERAAGALADATMVTSGAITKRVDRLVERGLVSRRLSDADGRGRVIALTPTGRDLIDRAVDAHVANEHRLIDDALTPDESAELEALLTRWLSRYEPISATADE